jgi:hypothetical protein
VVKVLRGKVQHCAIVPHDEVVVAPRVLEDELVLRGVLDEELDEVPRFQRGPAGSSRRSSV